MDDLEWEDPGISITQRKEASLTWNYRFRLLSFVKNNFTKKKIATRYTTCKCFKLHSAADKQLDFLKKKNMKVNEKKQW